ncbi:uncharacterized protein LOC123892575 isoform X3 [Trifolium pratense]|uniref:uncharacterized protein LOC123892575 isoform X3 n=1 Tax=Trifolium pratense TaxID=57577 RepID=UPI001E6935F9|nr:uncharacterized protein LOC123892575 isoform X3 [Trifolium pratense]XP_045798347.1 uncharacterized protein LOC123892575 isoform X3 [Trifolium pratense]
MAENLNSWFQHLLLRSPTRPLIVLHRKEPCISDSLTLSLSPIQSIFCHASLRSGTSAEAWVGDAGGAYSNGHHLVSDAFDQQVVDTSCWVVEVWIHYNSAKFGQVYAVASTCLVTEQVIQIHVF